MENTEVLAQPGPVSEKPQLSDAPLFRTCPGFELYVPPTPFSNPPPPQETARFVLLDDDADTFYNVDYGSPDLQNKTSWTELALHEVSDPAIIFPPVQWEWLPNPECSPIGFLVNICSRDTVYFTAVILGKVHVKRLRQKFMNWNALESVKGPELPAELKAGLLRKVFNRRAPSENHPISYVNPRQVLDNMSRPWHRDGSWLSWELDHRFVGGRCIDEGQVWKLYYEHLPQVQGTEYVLTGD